MAPGSRQQIRPCGRQQHFPGMLVLLWLWAAPVFLGACGVFGNQAGERGLPGPTRANTAGGENSAGTLKITTREPGMVLLPLPGLEKAGFPDGLNDLSQIRLAHRGQAQPVWQSHPPAPDGFIFYAGLPDSLYTQENVYLLEWGRLSGSVAQEAPPAEPAKGEAGAATRAALLLEENLQYAPQVEEGERWLWQSLPAPGELIFPFQLSGSVPAPGEIRLEVWASTEAPAEPDHHLRLRVNQQRVLDEAWDGRGRRRLTAALPEGLLVEGANVLIVEAVGDTGAPADIVSIDWIEIGFTRSLVAKDGWLEFESQGAPQALRNLDEPVRVFELGAGGQVKEASRRLEAVSGDLRFTGQAGQRYLAVDPDGYREPERIEAITLEPDLAQPGNGADYLAIGPPDLLEPLGPLLEWRAGQGLKTMAVPVETIYNQFGAGFPEPEAIHAYLQYTAENWQPSPRYVLLVGDATYDPRGYQSPPEANRLPVLFVTTGYGGETASDALLALLDGDGWPDVALGRVPARHPDQVRVFVEKTLAYEQKSAPGDWRRRILAVADGQEPAFAGDARHFLDQFPGEFDRQLYSPPAGAIDAPEQIGSSIENGALWVAYFGHGSVALWGKDRLFSAEDVPGLDNHDRLPVVVQMTCLTGLFTHPKTESLSEHFLFAERGGAVGVLAPTSLTLPLDQGFLSDALVQAYLEDPSGRIGDLILAAQRQIPVEDPGTRAVLLTYIWFGDPGLTLVGEGAP